MRGADLRAAESAQAHNCRTLLAYGGPFVIGVLVPGGGILQCHNFCISTPRQDW